MPARVCRQRPFCSYTGGRFEKAETPGELFSLNVAEGYGEGVGGVGRLGSLVHPQQGAHHQLHLFFVGVAVAGNASFHFAGRIRAYLHTVLLGGQQDNTANLSEPQSGAHVQRGEYRFHGHGMGPKFFDQLAEQPVDIMQARAGR